MNVLLLRLDGEQQASECAGDVTMNVCGGLCHKSSSCVTAVTSSLAHATDSPNMNTYKEFHWLDVLLLLSRYVDSPLARKANPMKLSIIRSTETPQVPSIYTVCETHSVSRSESMSSNLTYCGKMWIGMPTLSTTKALNMRQPCSRVNHRWRLSKMM